MSGFHKRQKHFSVKAENDTDAHKQGGWTRQSPEVPQPLCDLLLEKNARGRAAKNGMPSSVQETSTGLSSYLPVRLEKEGWSSLFSFSLPYNMSRFKFPPCTQLSEGFMCPPFCWAWLEMSVVNGGKPALTEERFTPTPSDPYFRVTGIAFCKFSSMSASKAK